MTSVDDHDLAAFERACALSRERLREATQAHEEAVRALRARRSRSRPPSLLRLPNETLSSMVDGLVWGGTASLDNALRGMRRREAHAPEDLLPQHHALYDAVDKYLAVAPLRLVCRRFARVVETHSDVAVLLAVLRAAYWTYASLGTFRELIEEFTASPNGSPHPRVAHLPRSTRSTACIALRMAWCGKDSRGRCKHPLRLAVAHEELVYQLHDYVSSDEEEEDEEEYDEEDEEE